MRNELLSSLEINDASWQELAAVFNHEYQDFIKHKQPRAPKKMLSEADEEFIAKYLRDEKRNNVGNQYYFERNSDGVLRYKKFEKALACHAFLQYDVWRSNKPEDVQVYLPSEDLTDDPRAEYYRWLAMESPYADFLYEQRSWGSYVIGDNSAPTYQLAAAFSMARRFSEFDNPYPTWETTQQIEKELGFTDPMLAIMYAQCLGYDSALEPNERIYLRNVDGHTLFSAGYFDHEKVCNLLLGKYVKHPNNPTVYTYYNTMWGKNQAKDWIEQVTRFQRNLATANAQGNKKDTTPNPFGVDFGTKTALKYPVHVKRKAFLLTMLYTIRQYQQQQQSTAKAA